MMSLLQIRTFFKNNNLCRPGVNFFCDINNDPFLYMEQNNKTYGFTISMEEFRDTVASLWETVKGKSE